MIQLATDPNASRSNWRPAAADAKDQPASARRSRNGQNAQAEKGQSRVKFACKNCGHKQETL